MHVSARVPGEPSFDLRVLLGAGVIGDQMQAQFGWSFPVDTTQERQPLQCVRCGAMRLMIVPSRYESVAKSGMVPWRI